MTEPGIEVRKNEIGLTPESMRKEYYHVQDSLRKFFGPGQELSPETVRTIEVRQSPRLRLTKPTTLACFRPKERKVQLFTDVLQEHRHAGGTQTAEGTFRHELGHAYHDQLQRETGKTNRAGTTSSEAFADWIRVVVEHNGDKAAVNKAMEFALRTGGRLFDTYPKSVYPDSSYDKVKSAAILNFLYQKYGMNAVLETCADLPPLVTRPQQAISLLVTPILFPLHALGIFTTVTDKINDAVVTRPLEKRYQKYEQYICQKFQVRSFAELTQQAVEYYTRQQRADATQARYSVTDRQFRPGTPGSQDSLTIPARPLPRQPSSPSHYIDTSAPFAPPPPSRRRETGFQLPRPGSSDALTIRRRR